MLNPTKKWLFIKGSSLLLIPLMIWFSFVIAVSMTKNSMKLLYFLQPNQLKS